MLYPTCFVFVCDRFSLPGGVDSAVLPPFVFCGALGPAACPLEPNVHLFSFFFLFTIIIMVGAHKMATAADLVTFNDRLHDLYVQFIAPDWCSLSV
jgi:hypothetical protein